MTRTKALAKLYKAVSGAETNKKTIAGILKDMYYALIGSETTKISVADILSQMADNYDGSGSGGGGDSSDLSTAQVTIVGPEFDWGVVFLPCIYEDGQIDAILDGGLVTAGTYTVPMYKGTVVGNIQTYDADVDVSVSGNAIYEDGSIMVTGDCTITFESLT